MSIYGPRPRGKTPPSKVSAFGARLLLSIILGAAFLGASIGAFVYYKAEAQRREVERAAATHKAELLELEAARLDAARLDAADLIPSVEPPKLEPPQPLQSAEMIPEPAIRQGSAAPLQSADLIP